MLPGMSIGEKLKKAESISKDKQKARVWIANLILILRKKLLEIASSKSPDALNTLYTLETIQKSYTLLKTTNVNPRFAIEITILSI